MTTETTRPLALPLRADSHNGTYAVIVSADGNDLFSNQDENVAMFGSPEVAAEIVRRVNLHDELVEALRESTDLVPRISGDDPMAPALADWLRNVRAVLAKVDGLRPYQHEAIERSGGAFALPVGAGKTVVGGALP